MEVPDLVAQRLDGETPDDAVSVGDESTVFFLPDRTVVYRGEGLLSDESVSVYGHDIERLSVSEGRRKTTFRLAYVNETAEFGVPSRYGDAVLEGILAGVLGVAGVTDSDEQVVGVYRFSELTLVVTDTCLVKHVGAAAWDDDYEVFPFAEVSGLEFEEGSVATQVVLRVDGRPERVKTPSGEAAVFRETLAEALCAFHDTTSLARLNDRLGPTGDDDTGGPASGIGLDDSIAPLVGSGQGETDDERDQPEDAADLPGEFTRPDEKRATEHDDVTTDTHDREDHRGGRDATTGGTETERLHQQVADLTAAVERQNRLLERQHEALAELLDRFED